MIKKASWVTKGDQEQGAIPKIRRNWPRSSARKYCTSLLTGLGDVGGPSNISIPHVSFHKTPRVLIPIHGAAPESEKQKTLSYRTNLSEGNTLAEAGIEKKQLDRACGDVRFRPRVLRSRGKIFDRSHPKSMLIPPQMLWNSTLPLSDHNIGESPLLQWALSELERRRGRGTPQITMLL